MDVAIVILNWNGKQHLSTYLPSVVRHSKAARIIVADNASTDDSLQFLADNYPQVELIKNAENGGFAKGYNDALANVKAEYYVLLNSDVEVTENWLNAPLALLESNPEIAVCQPKLLAHQQKDTFEYAGACGGFIDRLGYPFCRGRIFQQMEVDQGQYDQLREVFWASGACMFIRSACFHEAGGFDARYFAHMEEIDLCWRLKNLGYQIYCEPKSVVYHLGGGTLSNANPRKTYLNFRNSLITLYKNHHGSPAGKIIIRLLLDGIAFLKLLIDGGPKHAFAILRAHFSFYAMLGELKRSQTTRAVSDIYQGKIVWEHFLKGVKQFNHLKKGFSRSVK